MFSAGPDRRVPAGLPVIQLAFASFMAENPAAA
jgi:hypothetical protein